MDNKWYWKKPLTTAELLDEIEQLSEGDPVPDTIYITPPDDNGFDSNEDSGDEDCNDPNRLNSMQLQAQAETNIEEENGNSDEDSNVREPEGRQKKSRKNRQAVRYSAKEKQKVEIPQPNVIHCYNRFMGGVDQMDNNVANYRIGFRGKKWYIPILFWMFDVSINNAWILARKFGKKIDNLEFRRSIVLSILQKYGKPPLSTGPKPILVSPAARRHGQHLILSGQTRRRCAHCKNKTTKACDRCEVALHDKCFLDFHRK